MSDIKHIIGERIRNHRTRLGLTQEALAELCEIHPTYIGQMERGEKNSTIESIEKIVYGLGISFETLFEQLGPPDTRGATIASQCYEIVDALSGEQQQAVLDLLSAYKKL